MERREKLPEGLCAGIDRLVELFQLEGRSPLQVPEQFTAYLFMMLESQWERLYVSDYISEEDFYRAKAENRIWGEMLGDVSLVQSEQLYRELSRLLLEVHDTWRGLSLEDCSRLGDLFDYVLKAVFCKGGKTCFFTPVNIASLLVGLTNPEGKVVWDPACGSGTLLVQVMKEAQGMIEPDLMGSDVNEQMVRLTRMNLFFHGIRSAYIAQTDSLKEPQKADVILANPPVISGSAAHLDFVQMISESLNPGGRAAVLINEAFLFTMHAAERKIRENLLEKHGLSAVFSLPEGVFAPYTSAKSSVLLFGDKQESREPVLFYEIRQVGYTLNKRCTPTDQNEIPDAIKVYRDRDWHYGKWTDALNNGTNYNANGVEVPEDWEERFWFAERESIRQNDYILLADRYRPVRREEQRRQESIGELVRKLGELEQGSRERLQELEEIFGEKGWL